MHCAGFNIQDELDQIPLDDVLPEVGTIGRYALAKDGHGGRTATWTPAATTVMCAVSTPGRKPGQPVSVGERLRDESMDFKIQVPHSVYLNAKDRITINNVVYDIQGEQERASYGIFNVYWGQIVTEPNEQVPA